MMELIVLLCIAFIVGLVVGAFLWRHKSTINDIVNAQPSIASTPNSTPSPTTIESETVDNDQSTQETRTRPSSQKEDLYSDEAFTRRHGVAPHCDGKKCNPSFQCNNGERMFCMNVMGKLDERYAGRWAGQHEVKIVPKSRRLDFALQLPDGRGIGIEFDGYSSHGQLDQDKFQDQIDRNNALVAKGWVLLRFSYNDAKNKAGECINIINGIFNSTNAIGSARIPWAQCRVCKGRMTHTIRKEKPYWLCLQCGDLFFDNNGFPSKKPVGVRNSQ